MKTILNPKNFACSIRPLYYISRLVGLSPIAMDGSNNLKEVSIKWKIYSAFVLLILVISSTFSIVQRVKQSELVATVIVNEFLMMSVGAIKAITSVLLCLTVNRSQVRRAICKIVKIDSSLLNNPEETYRKMYLFTLIQTSVVSIYTTFLFVYDTIVWTHAVEQMDSWYLITGYPHRIVNITSVVQFCDFVLLLRNRIKSLNFKLIAILKATDLSKKTMALSSSNRFSSTSSYNILNHKKSSKEKTPKFISIADSNKVFTHVEPTPIKTSEVDTLHNLRELYDELCDVTSLINSIYGLLLLLELGVTTIELTSSLYLLLATLLKIQTVEIDIMSQFTSLMIAWLIQYSFKLICITAPSQAATNEMENTIVLVHKLLLAKRFDHGTIMELKLFSQQLLQRKVKFTAFGFLNLDYSLLFTIIGGVTTYLVIAMQYKK